MTPGAAGRRLNRNKTADSEWIRSSIETQPFTGSFYGGDIQHLLVPMRLSLNVSLLKCRWLRVDGMDGFKRVGRAQS